MKTASSSPSRANTSPSTLTSRSPRVPPVSTIRQKCETRRPQRVAGGALLPLVAQLDRRGRHATGHPAQGDVEVDPGSGVRRHAAADLAEDQPVAVERPRRPAPPLSAVTIRLATRDDVSRSPPCGPALIGLGVDDAGLLGEGDVQHRADVRRVVLAVLVEGDDPVPAGGGHPGERGRVLAVVAAEPHHPDEGVGLRQLAQQAARVVGAAVVDQQDLRHPERPRRPGRRVDSVSGTISARSARSWGSAGRSGSPPRRGARPRETRDRLAPARL